MDINLLQKIINNSFSLQELNQFLHHCTSIVSARLKTLYFRNKLYFPFIINLDKDIHDFAIDICIPLFARNDKNEFHILKTFFESKMDEIDHVPEKGVFYLNKLLFSHTHQELIKQFQIHDPSGWRIYRNLGLTADRNSKISAESLTGKKYYFYCPEESCISFPCDLNPQLPEIDLYSLKQLLSENLKNSHLLPELLEKVLFSCYQQKSWRKFVSRSLLFTALKDIMLLKTVHFDTFRFEDNSLKINNGLPEDPLKLTYNVLNRLISDISRYIQKGKIDEKTGEDYEKLIQQYFSDLMQFGEVAKLGDYMRKINPELLISKQTWLYHRNRIEYLIKTGKSYLKGELSENESNGGN